MKTLLHRAARSLLLLLLAAAIPYLARAQDRQVEAGFEDDLTVKGTSGTDNDPDLEAWGFSGFGTNISSAVMATSGVGSVYIQNHLEVGSNAYVHGGFASGMSTGFQVNASGDITRIDGVSYNWSTNQGGSNTFLRNDGAGNLSWGYQIPATITMVAQGAALAWANQPVALTEFLGATRHRTKVDLSAATQVRMVAQQTVAGAAAAKLAAQYSTDQVTWIYFAATNSPIMDITNIALKVTGWSNMVAGARTDVFIRLIGYGGNATADPAFGLVTLQFR